MTVLIVTLPGDTHAHAVSWAIEKLGGDVKTIYPFDICDISQWSLDPDTGVIEINSRGDKQIIRRSDYDTVWMRRPSGIYPLTSITDMAQRAAAEDELKSFVMGALGWLEHDKFTVNQMTKSGMSASKTYQMAVAASLGLKMPTTLISNSKEEILSFFDQCDQHIIYKPLKSTLWSVGGRKKTIVPTTVITDRSLLSDSDLQSARGIYQEKIEKQAELRATFMGKSIFCWEKRFSQRSADDLDVDWRMMNKGAEHKVHILPHDIQQKCFKLMSALNLHYGAFDFVIDQEGNYYFLEVNPGGQFLWGDELGLGLNQLEAFAEFLLSGDPEFQYSNSNRLNIQDYHQDVEYEKMFAEEQALHTGTLLEHHYKVVSIAF